MSAFVLSVNPAISPEPLNFEFWRGEAPQLISENLQQFTKPGKDGHGERKLGLWGKPFTCELESHWSNYASALAAYAVYIRVPGSGPVQVIYNNVNFTSAGIKFTVQDVKLSNDTHARILQIGPNYAYAGAGILKTVWQMTPIKAGA